jgi:hypothetical protein
MKVHIARQGSIIGCFDFEQIPTLIGTGEVLTTDFWWKSGMDDWKGVSELVPIATDNDPHSEEQPRDEECDWRSPPPHEPDPNGDQPASPDQLNYLSCFVGIKDIPVNLTRYDAQRWIEILMESTEANNPESSDDVLRQYIQTRDAYLRSFSGRTPSGTMHRMIDHHLSVAAEESSANETYMDEGDWLTDDDEDQEDGSLEAAKELMKLRVDHWIWIMKCAHASNRDEVEKIYGMLESQMDMPRALIDSLEKVALNLIEIPGEDQVQEMLSSLDKEHGYWDDEEPDLLIKSFVEAQSSKRQKGEQ